MASPSARASGGAHLGSSPLGDSFDDHMQKHQAAKAFWKRLKYDDQFETSGVTVGYIQVDIKAQRKSGKEAWSDRRVEDVVEAPFQELCRTWGDSVPYHAIRYFKDHGLLSWSSGQVRESVESAGTSGRVPSDQGDAACSSSQEGATAVEALPDECWRMVGARLTTRDVCALSCACVATQRALDDVAVWRSVHTSLFGCEAESGAGAAAVKRICRRSELQACAWFTRRAAHSRVGFSHTSCVVMDESKVISAHGGNIRVWSPNTGGRFASIAGSVPVSRLAFSRTHLAALDDFGFRTWDIDDLKAPPTRCSRPARDLCFFGDMLVAAERGGTIKVLDPAEGGAAGHVAVLELAQEGGVDSVACGGRSSIVAGGGQVALWDMHSGTRSLQLFDGSADASNIFQLLAPPSDPTLGVRFHHLAMDEASNLLAGVSSTLATSLLALWDVRTGALVNVVRASDHPIWQHHAAHPPAAVLLDHYKLVLGTPGGIAVHDIRAASAHAFDHAWPRCVRTFVTGAGHAESNNLSDEAGDDNEAGASRYRGDLPEGTELTCLAVHGKRMVAGFDSGDPCMLWAFGREAIESTPLVQAGLADLSLQDDDDDVKGKKGSKKPKNVPKRQQNRYPKRGR